MADAPLRLPCALALTGLLALGACATPTAATQAGIGSPPRGELLLEFDEGLGGEGSEVDVVQSSGTATLRIKVRSHAGGALERVAGRSGFAIRTPAFDSTGKAPVAVMVVKPRGSDQLSPGDRSVRWGVDVMLDAEQGESATDNGDNVLQRGLFEDQGQLKLQLDHGVASCRAQGTTGQALVTADEPLPREQWHRIQCELRNDELSLRVGEPGRPSPQEWSVPADVGEITFRRSEPIAIGGKVDRRGRVLTEDADQFNGLLDNVFMDIFG